MSAQTRRRDCSTCEDPRKLLGNADKLGFFSCPRCNRKYERTNTLRSVADQVLGELLQAPKHREIPEPVGSAANDNPSATAWCDRLTDRDKRGSTRR